MMQGNRKRSHSPNSTLIKMDTSGRRRDGKSKWDTNDLHAKSHNSNSMGMNMNNMMMNNMYSQGNVLLNNMYQNMMVPGMTMQDMMSGGGMDIMAQQQMDISMAQGMGSAMAQGMGSAMAQAMGAPMAQGMGPPMAQTIGAPMAQGIATGMQPGIPPNTPIDMNMMGGMMVDPSSMMGIGMYPPNMGGTEMMAIEPQTEIVLKTCILSPPPGGQVPQTRSRPPGCRTIFVGGLPGRIREHTVREVFEQYGRIHTLRLSHKSFCHIRYDREAAVDQAIQISGYRLILTEKENGNKKEDETPISEDSHEVVGWIHVDYAMSRDDENDYKRMQRQALRVQQQEMDHYQMNDSIPRRRSPSPPKVHAFSSTNIVQIAEKIKSEDYFAATLPTLISWLERGECSKKNSSQFYSMIQATNAHIRRLFNEKMQSEEELQECRDKVKVKIEKIVDQLEQVSRVFTAAMRQRVWDHFTKPQRKNIETWQKMAQEFSGLREEFAEKFDDEREFPDSYQTPKVDSNYEELMELRKSNASLQFQIEAYKNEIDVIKTDSVKEMEKFKAQYIARQALQNAKPPLPKALEMPPLPPPLPAEKDAGPVEAGCGEAKLIGITAAFLQVHPQGASLDYVVSYVRAMFPQITHQAVHEVLMKHKDVFQQQTLGCGANIEKRWSFIVFKNLTSSQSIAKGS